MCPEVPRRWREGGCCRRLPGCQGGPGSFPRAQVAALESLRQRAPAPASLPIGAGELGTLPPARPPAFQPPRARPGGRRDARAGAPEPLQPIGAAGQGERGARVSLEGTSLRSAGKEGADAWRGGVEAPRPEARRPSARLATRHPWPAAWLGTGCGRAVCLCAPGPSGPLRRSCSGHPGRQVRTLRAPSEHRPLLRHSWPPRGRRCSRSRGARQGHASRARRQLGPVPSVAWGWFQ